MFIFIGLDLHRDIIYNNFSHVIPFKTAWFSCYNHDAWVRVWWYLFFFTWGFFRWWWIRHYAIGLGQGCTIFEMFEIETNQFIICICCILIIYGIINKEFRFLKYIRPYLFVSFLVIEQFSHSPIFYGSLSYIRINISKILCLLTICITYIFHWFFLIICHWYIYRPLYSICYIYSDTIFI